MTYKLTKCRSVGFLHDAMSSHIQLLTAGEEGWQNKELGCACYRVEGGGGEDGMKEEEEEEEGELRVVVHCGSAAPAALLLCCLAQPSSLAGSQSQRREAVPHQFSVSERRGEGGDTWMRGRREKGGRRKAWKKQTGGDRKRNGRFCIHSGRFRTCTMWITSNTLNREGTLSMCSMSNENLLLPIVQTKYTNAHSAFVKLSSPAVNHLNHPQL